MNFNVKETRLIAKEEFRETNNYKFISRTIYSLAAIIIIFFVIITIFSEYKNLNPVPKPFLKIDKELISNYDNNDEIIIMHNAESNYYTIDNNLIEQIDNNNKNNITALFAIFLAFIGVFAPLIGVFILTDLGFKEEIMFTDNYIENKINNEYIKR